MASRRQLFWLIDLSMAIYLTSVVLFLFDNVPELRILHKNLIDHLSFLKFMSS